MDYENEIKIIEQLKKEVFDIVKARSMSSTITKYLSAIDTYVRLVQVQISLEKMDDDDV